MKCIWISVAEPGSDLSKLWYKLVGQVRTQVRTDGGKVVQVFTYIDYGVSSAWKGN